MKILFVLPSLEAGGAEKVVITLANALALKYEVSLFVLLDRGLLFPTVSPQVNMIRGPAKGNTWWKKGVILKNLMNVARQHDVVVAGLEVTATYFAYVAAKFARKPMVAWVHTLLAEYLQLGYFSSWHTYFCRWLYARIPSQVFVSEGARTSMQKLTGSPRGIKHSVIYNPVCFPPKHVLPLMHLPPKPFILAVGRLAPEKGFEFLLQAFAKLIEKGEDIALLILGEGPLREPLTEKIKVLNIEKYVYLPGFVEEVMGYYSHAKVFALSSTVEGLSMALLEAMQSEVPIVATKLPSVEELLGPNIQMVGHQDVNGFAQALQDALHIPESAELKKARRLKAESFTPQYAVNLWDKVLQEAIRRK